MSLFEAVGIADHDKFAAGTSRRLFIKLVLLFPPYVLDFNIEYRIEPFYFKVGPITHCDLCAILQKHQSDASLREVINYLSWIWSVLLELQLVGIDTERARGPESGNSMLDAKICEVI